MHLLIPLFFGSIGTAFGYSLVFVTNSALLVGGGILMRKAPLQATAQVPEPAVTAKENAP
jgi:hypothetical protein